MDIWNNVFSVNTVTTEPTPSPGSGQPLWYYHNYNNVNCNATSLLLNSDGQCGSWACLMLDVLAVQGITFPNPYVQIGPCNQSDNGFLVNFWQFNSSNASTVVVGNLPGLNSQQPQVLQNYPSVAVIARLQFSAYINSAGNGYQFDYSDVTYGAGEQGKGPNNLPASLFGNHQFTVLPITFDFQQGSGATTTWFDPSYGCYYLGTTDVAKDTYFTTNSLSGFVSLFYNATVTLNGNNVTRDVLLIRRTVLGEQGVQVSQ